MKPKKFETILVCGGRKYDDAEFLVSVLDHYKSKGCVTILHGAATGADSLAGAWARARGVEELQFPADWNRYKKAAGFVRNQQMLDMGKPDLVVAFPGGNGTEHMMKRAHVANVPVVQVSRGEAKCKL